LRWGGLVIALEDLHGERGRTLLGGLMAIACTWLAVSEAMRRVVVMGRGAAGKSVLAALRRFTAVRSGGADPPPELTAC
jgi:hypothetical protein